MSNKLSVAFSPSKSTQKSINNKQLATEKNDSILLTRQTSRCCGIAAALEALANP